MQEKYFTILRANYCGSTCRVKEKWNLPKYGSCCPYTQPFGKAIIRAFYIDVKVPLNEDVEPIAFFSCVKKGILAIVLFLEDKFAQLIYLFQYRAFYTWLVEVEDSISVSAVYNAFQE